jgi:hypothetical protein
MSEGLSSQEKHDPRVGMLPEFLLELHFPRIYTTSNRNASLLLGNTMNHHEYDNLRNSSPWGLFHNDESVCASFQSDRPIEMIESLAENFKMINDEIHNLVTNLWMFQNPRKI